MKKLYTLSLVLFGSLASFAQVFYSENFGTPIATTLIPAYSTGTAPATFQNGAPIAYSGTSDVRTSSASTGYTGASGGGNVFITSNIDRYFQIDGLNTASYASADLQLTFGLNASTNLPVLEKSTDGGTTWTAITYTTTGTTAWKFVTVSGGLIPSSSTLSLRWSQINPLPTSNNQYRIDDVTLRNGANTCVLSLGAPTTLCDAFTTGTDTYTATIPFTGGGTATYAIVTSTGTISGDNPSTLATGNITITGVTEGTAINVTVTGGTCSLSSPITAPQCAAVNALPFVDHFGYAIGSSLTASQVWGPLNTGDDISVIAGNLNYTGITGSGNSVSFAGAGIDGVVKTTPTTTGALYAAFLFQVTDYSTVTTDGAQAYFASLLGTSNTAFNGRVWVKKSGTGYLLGGTNTAAATETSYGSTVYNVGDTVLIIVGYDFTSSTMKFWFNPTVATFNANTAPTISEAVATPLTTLTGFLLRQDAANATPAITVDELKISNNASTLLSVAENNIAGLKVYPNPVTNGKLFIETANNGEKAVVVYDVLGKQVLNTTTSSNEVNVAGLTTGVYVVKITEEGNTATKKLVIK